ncbi:MAG: hypothetical protein ACHRXM_12570 [Isosphaerales bacterium]
MFGVAKPNPFPHLADITADIAAREVFTAAVEAAVAEGFSDQFIKGAVEDYEKLLRLDIGSYPQAGKPIDPSPDGPLGPLRPVSAALPPIDRRPSGAPHTTTTGTVSRCHAQ